ncbi:bifunctional hydroxymethylpyrimidine kinase/phosphomethylpyrimidine kinase [Falsibacillus albus]|uniref:Hydroxymethylpyrimidine/phosphomethylpyrimidine kinase n=1 Tax=Falsibacillus albus TaxID=2478915 RepID=A0A3L7K4B1_9BACI|nr:bifunctional hydroxymethylpyrimidine kinase/phosphomethylpyrimidine kinase [Falsibacillus albus]RLQ97495.1 bifunctional hydroxymethylpyrimidine kinase/phosphomethylpyrimidine kinase [Falsibacillus albus]
MKQAMALTIAGSDSGGGAGIQADLKTFQELKVYGMSALTAVTAQNTLGVQGVYPVPKEGVIQQLNAIEEDLRPQALKTGMLFSSDIIEAVAERIHSFQWKNIVVDPVMIAKGGASLLLEEAIDALKTHLLPVATVITPNIPEAEVLTGLNIITADDKRRAVEKLTELGPKYVILKGGHDENPKEAIDFFYDGSELKELRSERIPTKNTHGTGCTFSAALTAELAKGKSVEDAVETAKLFIQAAIQNSLEIGSGHGPTNHWAYQENNKQ